MGRSNRKVWGSEFSGWVVWGPCETCGSVMPSGDVPQGLGSARTWCCGRAASLFTVRRVGGVRIGAQRRPMVDAFR